jgi:predicted HicB family RNase H-like nuclease
MAKSTKSTNIQIPLELSIPQADHEVLEEAASKESISVQEYIHACVSKYLSAYANGGLMLSAEDLVAIGETSGQEITSSSDIVDAILSRAEDHSPNSFTISVDPSVMANVEESARVIGVSIEQWVHNCWGHILANGWLYAISADTTWIPLSKDQCAKVRSVIGRDCTSSNDVMDAIAAAGKR